MKTWQLQAAVAAACVSHVPIFPKTWLALSLCALSNAMLAFENRKVGR